MYNIVKPITVSVGLLLLIPGMVWLSGWHWVPTGDSTWLHIMDGISDSVTSPRGVITHILLSIWFLWCLRYRIKTTLLLFVLFGAIILLGQALTSVIKQRIEAPRPYVAWLESSRQLSAKAFYALPAKQRGEKVKQALVEEKRVPGWLNQYWQQDTAFSFPSGHTMFAASWALLGAGLLWSRRRYYTVILLVFWAGLVMVSRLVLGMHWPRDLFASVVISWAMVILIIWLARRWIAPSPKQVTHSVMRN